jgi:CMP-N,N'-diacetyllegionaminic acid synthase
MSFNIFIISLFEFYYILIMKVLAIIPARSGSKGIPLKNIKKLSGKPLIEYSINTAHNSKRIDKLIVSTDDKKIAKISKFLGAEVPFLRPKILSTDSSQTIDLVKHAIKKLEKLNYIPDIITILQPTSPFRTFNMIDESINLLEKSNSTSVISVAKIKNHPYSSFSFNGEYLKPVKKNFQKYYQRQLLPELLYPTGGIYTFWTSTLLRYNSIYGSKIKPMIIDDDKVNIDIDNNFDFFVAEMCIKHWKK